MPGLDALTAGAGQTDQRDARHAVGGLLALQGPSTLDVRPGVLHGPGTTQLITGTGKTGPKMSVLIGAHVAVTSRGTANGAYLGPTLDQPLEVDVDLAPASGSRIDIVWVKQRDTTSGVPTPDSTPGPLYGVLKGTATTGTPGKPDLSTIVGALELATVTVAAGATSTNGSGVTISQTARQTVARGAPIPVRSEAERDALQTYPGLHVTRLDLGGVIQRWITGSTWRSYLDETDLAGTTGALSLDTGIYKAADVSLGGTPKWSRLGDRMTLSGGITNAVTPFTAPAGPWYKFGNLPAGTFPAVDHPFSTPYATGAGYAIGWVRVRANGEMQYLPTTGAGPGFTIALEGVTWKIGA